MHDLRKNRIIQIILYPLSFVYGLITELRNWMFAKGVFKQESFSVPVISVGNITAGGTGKTPFTMLLIDLLKGDFAGIAVVSRGYGRKSKGLRIVSDGRRILIPVEESGDEPYLIAQKYPKIPVIVSEDRAKGIREAVDHHGASLILLDDAFQHRRVKRDCDIVLIKSGKDLTLEKILPYGNLRENLKHLTRADIVVYTGSSGDEAERIVYEKSEAGSDNVFNCIFKADKVVNANLMPIGQPELLKGKHCIAFAAIAKPQQFLNTLEECDIQIDAYITFPDHHFYSRTDHLRLLEMARKHHSDYLVTTEKDLVRVNADYLDEIELFGIRRIGLLNSPEKFMNKLHVYIDFK